MKATVRDDNGLLARESSAHDGNLSEGDVFSGLRQCETQHRRH